MRNTMPFEKAEKLKKEYTDKFVVVADGVPELRRFAGLTGVVKTVNMNGRALVEFAGTADISWYDIDPAYLKFVDAPVAKKADTKQPAAPADVKPAEKKPAPAQKKAASPLELARQQGAGTSAGTTQSSPTAPC